MNASYRFAAILAFALVSSQAQAIQPVDFSFTSGALSSAAIGNTYTTSNPATGLKITASAWSSATSNPSQFAKAALTLATDGLGVCNSNEFNCASGNLGSLGNSAGNDLILFSFNGPVGLQGLAISKLVGANSSLSIWAGTGTLPADSLSTSLLGSATQLSFAPNKDAVKLNSDFNAYYNWVAVAALIGGTNDLVKLKSLTVQINPQAQPVPDPSSWMTMLAGLGLVGFAVTRRTKP